MAAVTHRPPVLPSPGRTPAQVERQAQSPRVLGRTHAPRQLTLDLQPVRDH